VYSVSQQQIEVNDQIHTVAASCQCSLYRSGRKEEKLTCCQISEPVCTVCDQLLNELSLPLFDTVVVLLVSQYTAIFHFFISSHG